MKLLIVEDNEPSALALCRLLSSRMEHIECRIASTLAEGLNMSIEMQADITLLDLMLPGVPVDKVISSIRDFCPPVIVVSDVHDPGNEIMLKCFANGAQNFLTKGCLRTVLDTLTAKIEADVLVRAIIDAHFRNVLPKQHATQ